MDGMPLLLVAIVVAAGLFAIVALVLDMVERRNYESALRGSEPATRSGVEAGPNGYSSIDRERAESVR